MTSEKPNGPFLFRALDGVHRCAEVSVEMIGQAIVGVQNWLVKQVEKLMRQKTQQKRKTAPPLR